jgi:hypothetical protein
MTVTVQVPGGEAVLVEKRDEPSTRKSKEVELVGTLVGQRPGYFHHQRRRPHARCLVSTRG